jgi:hypothetical protein
MSFLVIMAIKTESRDSVGRTHLIREVKWVEYKWTIKLKKLTSFIKFQFHNPI